jgi:lysozyme-related protein Hpa2
MSTNLTIFMKSFLNSLLAVLSLFILMNNTAMANNYRDGQPIYVVGNQPCWDQAGAYHNVDPWLLYAIASVESHFNPVAYNRNSNGTLDFGMMQVNSSHFPELKKYGIPFEILANRCGSAYVGAWILSRAFKQCGRNWSAIGAYNSGHCYVSDYAVKVAKVYQAFVSQHYRDMGQIQNASMVARNQSVQYVSSINNYHP